MSTNPLIPLTSFQRHAPPRFIDLKEKGKEPNVTHTIVRPPSVRVFGAVPIWLGRDDKEMHVPIIAIHEE